MPHVDEIAALPGSAVTDSPTPADEPHLIRRAQQRDAAAFERLYRLHVRRVYALCLRMTANVVRAEELTQTAFIAVWDRLPRFRGESAFGSWLHRLAVNIVLMDMRTARRREERIFSTCDLPAFERAGVPMHASVRLDLEQAIAALPPQARIVFVLHDIEGWKHAEIATHLGIATGTAKTHLHHARKHLQHALQ
ncbi:MAG TPA: RNA polymerase sigma factor [Opitutaceae bacterium]